VHGATHAVGGPIDADPDLEDLARVLPAEDVEARAHAVLTTGGPALTDLNLVVGEVEVVVEDEVGRRWTERISCEQGLKRPARDVHEIICRKWEGSAACRTGATERCDVLDLTSVTVTDSGPSAAART
jgi:hypothetical protein